MTVLLNSIYIDHPYNTGMTNLPYDDYTYFDKVEEKENTWVKFMEERMKIANSLVTENGVIFIQLEDNELVSTLELSYKIFEKKNVTVLIWPKIDERFNQNRVERQFTNIKSVHEYILLCYKNKEGTQLQKIKNYEGKMQDLESIVKGLGTTSSAKDELEELLGSRTVFRTPKPMRLLKELIRSASKKDSIILDYFAGSGTAGQAVMDLNKEDSGSRRFILINNDENNICREITYERIKRSMEKEDYRERISYVKINTGEK